MTEAERRFLDRDDRQWQWEKRQARLARLEDFREPTEEEVEENLRQRDNVPVA